MFLQLKFAGSLFSRKRITLALLGIVVIFGLLLAAKVYRTKSLVKELFKMNKQLQEENYHMAEFEFKMLGIAYHLDRGHYSKSFELLDRLYEQMKTKKGLVKMPEFNSKEEELEFYRNLQNPKTGAFIDDAYPLSVQHEPTANVLLHMESLANETSQPLKLKYPLRYLDEINTPEKLTAFLDDVSTVGWIGSKFPQTSFHNARDILSLARDRINYDENQVDMVIQKNNLYSFSPEWKHTMLQWFYDHQDPETGLWGPKSKSGKLVKIDLSNTASIMKAFVDEEGRDIHPEFPLRFKEKLFESALKNLAEPPSDDDDNLAELHEWNLKTPKGLRMLTRYIWKDISRKNKEKARKLFENYIRIKFEKYYIAREGAFSYYPRGDHATLDGMGGFFIFTEIGALSSEKQKKLWGAPEELIVNLHSPEISRLTENDIKTIAEAAGVNSLRLYETSPNYDQLTSDVFAIVYPRKTAVLDIMDLTQNVKRWIETTSLTMGNWNSKSTIQKELESIEFKSVPIYKENIPLQKANDILLKNKTLVIIGFDVLQLPKYKIVYRYHPG